MKNQFIVAVIRKSILFKSASLSWLLACTAKFRLPLLLNVFLGIFSSVATVSTVIIAKQLIDTAVAGKVSGAIYGMVFFGLLYVANILAGILMSVITIRLSEKMNNKLQQRMLERLYRTEWSALNAYHSGDLLTRLTSDVGSVVGLWVSSIPTLVTFLVQFFYAFFTLLYYDKSLAIVAFILGPISLGISWVLGRRVKKLQHAIQAAESKSRSFISESIQNLLVIKSFEVEKISLRRVISNQNEKYKWVVKKSNLGIASNVILSVGYWVGYVIAFLMGVVKLSQKTATFGTFTAFLQLVGQVQSPFAGFMRTVPAILAAMASVERLMELETLEAEEARPEAAVYRGHNPGLIVENLSFRYTPDKQILKDTTAEMLPGKITALIGVSGEGKTTLMRLLLALLRPEAGELQIVDGAERKILSTGTRGYFTYVPQGNTLFSGTIADNLMIGNQQAGTEEIERALKAACAWEFVQEFRDGIHTVVGEGGFGLSEGQAQRLCIARALMKPSPILLLDEVTSALDMETEKKIFSNIREFEPKRTCIVITHRLSVLSSCDSVYRLESGRLYKHAVEEFDTLIGHGM